MLICMVHNLRILRIVQIHHIVHIRDKTNPLEVFRHFFHGCLVPHPMAGPAVDVPPRTSVTFVVLRTLARLELIHGAHIRWWTGTYPTKFQRI